MTIAALSETQMDGSRGLPNSFMRKSAPLFGIDGAVPSDCQPLTMEPNLKKKAEEDKRGYVPKADEVLRVAHDYPLHVETRIALLEQSIGHINQTLIEMKKDFKEGLSYNCEEIREFRRDVKSDHRWMFGLMIAFGTGLMGVMAHGFHWF